MKVVVVLPYLKAGGTERQASYIVNHLQDKGHEVTVIAIEKSGSFESLFNVPIDYLNSKNSYIRLIPNLYLLVKKIKELNPDVVVSRAWSANVITSMASWLTSKPWVLFLSGSADLSRVGFIKRIVHRMCIDKASKVISVSNGARKNIIEWLSISGNNIEVMHNGVDVEYLQKLANDSIELPPGIDVNKPSLIFVGRLIHRKGGDLLIKAVREIINKGEELNLIIVGEGDQGREYKKLVSDLKINRYVFFVGQKLNPFPYIKFSDIFILPSRSEGFPNVLLEAMAIGKPVIATDCETGPNEILNNQNGILVKNEDYKDLTKGIMMYLNSEPERISNGKNASDTVLNRFNLETQLNLIEEQVIKCVNR